MKIKLKDSIPQINSCPFCGGKAKFYFNSISIDHGAAIFYYRLQCTKCHITSPDTKHTRISMHSNGDFFIFDDERESLVKEWNKRNE